VKNGGTLVKVTLKAENAGSYNAKITGNMGKLFS
jgi:hypothetical protein